MPVERRGWVIAFEIGSTGNGRNPIFNGRRQPSCGGTSRMMREYQVRFCERLGVKFPANLSTAVRTYLSNLQLPNPDEDIATGELVWLHSLAICYSPAYLSENEDGVKRDFPRIPLPPDAALLRNSARIGNRLPALLDPDGEIIGVTRGTILPILRTIGTLARASRERGPIDLRVTVGWGYAGRDGVIMPGGGRVEEQIA